MTHDLLIRNARLPTAGRPRSSAPGDILIRNGSIAVLGAVQDAPGVPVLDAGGKLALPGLINAHVHSPGNLMRGCLDSLPLEIFMLYEVPPLAEAAQAARLAYLRTALGADAAKLEPAYRAMYLKAMARDVGLDRRGGQG